jgi:NADH:ubiquinone oxidoreductase subunit 6 (subunit J)
MNNKGVLIVIALVLIGILGIMVVNYNEEQKSPGQKISEGVSETVEEIGDEIDDATTAR